MSLFLRTVGCHWSLSTPQIIDVVGPRRMIVAIDPLLMYTGIHVPQLD